MKLIQLKRVYEKPSKRDGTRILVERLWPRGVTKNQAALDFWLKDIAPSNTLRKWFGHEPDKWNEFKRRYRRELRENPVQVGMLREQAMNGKITLVYSAKDKEHNAALVLKAFVGGASADLRVRR